MVNLKTSISTLMIASSVSVLLLTGCGSDSSYVPAPNYSGKVVDDYIKDAPVKTSTGISCGKSDKTGTFSCPAAAKNYPLEIDCESATSNCVDIATNLKFEGKLLAPKSSKVITPLTTLIQVAVEKGQSIEEAEKSVKEILGIADVDIPLTEFNPIDSLEAADNTQKTIAQKVFAAQTKVMTVLKVAASKQDVSLEDAAVKMVEAAIEEKQTDFVEIAKAVTQTDEIVDIVTAIPDTIDRATSGAILKVITENDDNITEAISYLDEGSFEYIKEEIEENLEGGDTEATEDEATDDTATGTGTSSEVNAE